MSYNSTITKLKSGQCFLYEGVPVFIEHDRGDGTASVCFSPRRLITDYYEVVNVDELEPINPAKISKSKPQTVEDKESAADLKEFFAYQATRVPEHCENCGKLLKANTAWAKKCVTGHILPKKDNCFPSVAANIDNAMFLGAVFSECRCHDLWDLRDAEARKTMECYPIALERYERFKSHLSDHELNMAIKYLGLGLSESRLSKKEENKNPEIA
jgi:hypothetical protein